MRQKERAVWRNCVRLAFFCASIQAPSSQTFPESSFGPTLFPRPFLSRPYLLTPDSLRSLCARPRRSGSSNVDLPYHGSPSFRQIKAMRIFIAQGFPPSIWRRNIPSMAETLKKERGSDGRRRANEIALIRLNALSVSKHFENQKKLVE